MFPRTVAAGLLLTGVILLGAPAENPIPAPLTDQINKVIPSWLKFSGEERVRFEHLNDVGFAAVNDGYLLNRFRFNLEVKPASWVRFSFQAQDSRVYGQNTLPAPATQKDSLDLRIGYVEFGAESSHAVLRLGRQPLMLGEQRLIGDPDWSNVGRSFDAARLILRNSWGRADVFMGAYVKIDPVSFSEPVPSQHLDGIYGTLSKIIPSGTVEPYVYLRLEHNFKNELGRIGNLDEKTAGLRLAGKMPYALDYSVDTVMQRGSYAGDTIAAWATHGLMGWTGSRLRTYGEWNQASGDTDLKDQRHQGFDLLYPAGHDKLGFDDLFGWSNIRHARAGAEYKINQRLMLMGEANGYWLGSAKDALYNSGGKVIARSASGAAGKSVGSEFDLVGRWTVRPGTVVYVGYGRLVPGEFLQRTTTGLTYNQVVLSLAQRF